jgi:hypothetical protein
MRAMYLVLAFLVVVSGCTASRLRHSTINQAKTLTDLQYQQVMDNLAQFTVNPYTLPWHVNLKTGVSQIQDTGSADIQFPLTSRIIPLLDLSGSRAIVEQWSNVPLTDDTMLKLVQAAYQNAVGVTHFLSWDEANDLAHDLTYQIGTNADISIEEDTLRQIFAVADAPDVKAPLPPTLDSLLEILSKHQNEITQSMDDTIISSTDMSEGKFHPDKKRATGLVREIVRQVNDVQKELISVAALGTDWYGKGRLIDVPHDAIYVSHSGHQYVWVCNSGIPQLSQLTLSVLHIASLVRDIQVVNAPSGIQFSPSISRGGTTIISPGGNPSNR